MTALRSAERYISLTMPAQPGYDAGPAVHPDRLRALEAIRWVGLYAGRLEEAYSLPNGDDFREVVEGVRTILMGGQTPRICITHSGR